MKTKRNQKTHTHRTVAEANDRQSTRAQWSQRVQSVPKDNVRMSDGGASLPGVRSQTGTRTMADETQTTARQAPSGLGKFSAALATQYDVYNFYHKNRPGSVFVSKPKLSILTADDAELDDFLMEVIGQIAFAETVYVNPEIAEALEVATPTLGEYVLHKDDVPFPRGFAYIDRDWFLCESLGGFYQDTRALFWTPATLGTGHSIDAIVFLAFGHSRDPKRPLPSDRLMQLNGSVVWQVGMSIEESVISLRAEIEERLAPDKPVNVPVLHWDPNSVQYDTHHLPVDREKYLDYRCKMAHDILTGIASIWAFMSQRIVAKNRYRAERAERRRLTPQWSEKDITVVTLRAYKPNPEPHPTEHIRDVDWSCRWAVRGHWRNQYVPSTKTHRKLWVSPYIKGPSDKPFKNATKLFAVVR